MPIRRKLGQFMLRRRGELGYTVTRATELAGISASTWHALERGRRVTAQSRTFYAVDRALRWLPGTTQQLFDGLIDEPVEVTDLTHAVSPQVTSEVAALLMEIETDLVHFDADGLRIILLEIKRKRIADVTTIAGLVPRWPQEPRKDPEAPEGTLNGQNVARNGGGGPYLSPGELTPRAS